MGSTGSIGTDLCMQSAIYEVNNNNSNNNNSNNNMRSLIAGVLSHYSLNRGVSTFLLFICAVMVCVHVTLPMLVLVFISYFFKKVKCYFESYLCQL